MVDVEQFEAEYCPPIDTALYSAIISDFDLSTEDGVAAARATLDPLKESAELEEAAGFDAAGVGSHDVTDSLERSSRPDQSVFDSENVSQITDDSSLSHRFSPLNLNSDGTSADNDNDMDDFDEETKILLLHEVFGEQVTSETIKAALHRSNGRWHSAMEDLLNQVFLDADASESISAKGVDGFAIDEGEYERVKKGRKSRQKGKGLLPVLPQNEEVVPLPSKWDQSQKDVELLSTSLHLSQADARAMYNKNGRSMPRTIEEVLKPYVQKNAPVTTELSVVVQDLVTTYALTPETCTAIAHATQSSLISAHKVASALTVQPKTKDIAIVPQYAAPIDEGIEGSTWQTVATKKRDTASLLFADDLPRQTQLDAARRTMAFEQARAAHRKAKSDRLMGAAAGYYSQVARDHGARIHSANAASADKLADMQSSAFQVDLHGVDVLNGVRIAQQRVEGWWRSTAEQRASGRAGAAQRSTDYSIVVGRGTHSEGGKSKLGPSVTKMLRAEGWRFTHEGAVIVVKGKQK